MPSDKTFWKETLKRILMKQMNFFFSSFQLSEYVCLHCLSLAVGQKEVVEEGKQSLECRLKSPNRVCPVPLQPPELSLSTVWRAFVQQTTPRIKS